MADGISIALSSISDFTAVNVDGLGVIKVKKESSNQGLKHSENIRDIYKLQDEAKRFSKQMDKLLAEGKEKTDPEVVKLESKATETLDRITDIRKEEQDLRRARLFDDEDGKLVKLLFENASDEDIAKLFAVADGTPIPEEKPNEAK